MTGKQEAAPPAVIVTTPTDRVLQVERVFDAPRERVFAMFTDPELIPRWWGPRGVTTVVDRMDVCPGGAWRFVVRHPDGRENAFRGEFREITPPELVVQTFEWEGLPGAITVDSTRFEDLGERTRMTVTSVFDAPQDLQAALASDMERGMNEMYARLDEALAKAA